MTNSVSRPLMGNKSVLSTDIFVDGTDVVIVKDGVEVFRRAKSSNSVLVANALYFYHKYGGKI